MNRIYLNIPFAKKDEVKSECHKNGTAIRFDFAGLKRWYWEGVGELPEFLSKYSTNTNSNKKKSAINYSAEQQAVIDAAREGLSIEVNACAGSGKTATIVGAANELDKMGKRGHVFYFGAANAKEGREKLPASTSCSTFHSMAFQSLSPAMRKRVGKVTPYHFAQLLNIDIPMAMSAMMVVQEFCKSTDKEVSQEHCKVIYYKKSEKKRMQLKKKAGYILDAAKKIWKVQTDIGSGETISHDIYLKMWALTNPVLGVDYIMIDEFQDTSPVNFGVIKSHIDAGKQVIVVGDKNQSIFQFTGAINAFNQVDLEMKLRLTQSFRNGQKIVNLAATVLNRFSLTGTSVESFKGLDNGASIGVLNAPHAYISRNNSTLVSRLLLEIKLGRKPYVIGGTDNLYRLIKACDELMEGKETTHPDLSVFDSWSMLVEYSETELGADMKPLVTMVNDYGTPRLLEAIDSVKYVRQQDADIILTTAHKSKGLEFKSVKLANDFRLDKNSSGDSEGKNDTLTTQSKNLMYVAITRTLGDLDVSSVDYLN